MIFVGQKTINTFLLLPLTALSGQYDEMFWQVPSEAEKKGVQFSVLVQSVKFYYKLWYNVLIKDLVIMWLK